MKEKSVNKFGEDFLRLVNNTAKPLVNFPEEKIIKFSKNSKEYLIPFIELTFENFVRDLMINCYNIAIEKAKKTMPQDQAGNIRPPKIKVVNQFRGVLAETIVHLFLYYKCNVNIKNIYRYDLERETFDYKPQEYDIKVVINNEEKELEIRSSNNPYNSLENYLARRGVICAYTNSFKLSEDFKDLSIAVIYDKTAHTGPLSFEQREKFIKDFAKNEYKIYLVTHCATKRAAEVYGKIKEYGQHGTKYIEVAFCDISSQNYHIKNLIK